MVPWVIYTKRTSMEYNWVEFEPGQTVWRVLLPPFTVGDFLSDGKETTLLIVARTWVVRIENRGRISTHAVHCSRMLPRVTIPHTHHRGYIDFPLLPCPVADKFKLPSNSRDYLYLHAVHSCGQQTFSLWLLIFTREKKQSPPITLQRYKTAVFQAPICLARDFELSVMILIVWLKMNYAH